MKSRFCLITAICFGCLPQQGVASTLVSQVLTDVTVLSSDDMQGRKPGTDGHAKAKAYIQQRFKQLNLASFSASYEHNFEYSTGFNQKVGTNLTAWIKGNRFPEQYIVITAHYDHLGTKGSRVYNGADDNASGVAALFAIATEFAALPPSHSIIFVATDAEEDGLIGAKAWLESPPVDLTQLRLNINLDMLGHGGRRNTMHVIAPRGNKALKNWLKEAIKPLSSKAMTLRFGEPRQYRGVTPKGSYINWRDASDHASFAAQGIDYVYFGTNVHTHYHQPTDTVDRFDQDFYLNAVGTIVGLARQLDEHYGASQTP